MLTIPTFWKYVVVNKNEKVSEISTLVAAFCHNALSNTHKTNNNYKVLALITKCILGIQKQASEKN